MDQELPEAHVLYFLVAVITDVERQDLTLESPAHPVFTASGFLPVTLNFDILVSLVLDKLLDPLSDDLGLHKGSEGSHDAA